MFNIEKGAGPTKSGNDRASGIGAAENSAKKTPTCSDRALRLWWRLQERRAWRRFQAAHVIDGDESIVRARLEEWAGACETLAQLEAEQS